MDKMYLLFGFLYCVYIYIMAYPIKMDLQGYNLIGNIWIVDNRWEYIYIYVDRLL
jgi:hypothetical protein